MTASAVDRNRIGFDEMARWAAREVERLDMWLRIAPGLSEVLRNDRACAAAVVTLIDCVTSDTKVMARVRELRQALAAAAAKPPADDGGG